MNTAPTSSTDLEARARGLTVVMSGAVVVLSTIAWGAPGFAAAAVGAGLSAINVVVLTRLARQAVAVAAVGGPNTAIVRLMSALGAKTIVLLTVVWVICKSAGLRVLPFGLGLLVTVFSLLGAGLATSLRAERTE
jgi:hypothetical protein